MSISRQSLLYSLDTLLQPEKFKDYGPNGLQVEGKEPVSLLVSGVTASLALIDAAIEAQADAILVHHGLFWRGQDGRVTGWMKQRLQRLLAHDINLFAYHLPLDAHPTLGNNARLGAQLGWEVDAQGYFEAAAAAGAQVFLTGEISEPQAHLAKEMGVGFMAAGHHATERYGAPAVAAHVAQQLGIRHRFIEVENPA